MSETAGRKPSHTPYFNELIRKRAHFLADHLQAQRPGLDVSAENIACYLRNTKGLRLKAALHPDTVEAYSDALNALRLYYRQVLHVNDPSESDSEESDRDRYIQVVTEDCGYRERVSRLRSVCLQAHLVEGHLISETRLALKEDLIQCINSGLVKPCCEVPEAWRSDLPITMKAAILMDKSQPLSPDQRRAFLSAMESDEGLDELLRRTVFRPANADMTNSYLTFIRQNPNPDDLVSRLIGQERLQRLMRFSSN